MKTFKLLLILFASSTFTLSAQTEVKLTYNFAVGDEYALIQTSKQQVKQNLLGIEQIIDNVMGGSLSLKVISVTPTGAIVEARYTTMTMMMKLPESIPTVSFDSQGDSTKTENKVTKAMMNKPFTLTLTKHGLIENIEGEENLWSDFAGLGLDDNQVNLLKDQFQQNFGEQSIKSSFESVLVNYPTNKIMVGNTWINNTGIEVMGISLPLLAQNTWRLNAVGKDVANLSADGYISTQNKDQVITLPNGLKSTVDLSGTQKILSTINTKTGWPTEVSINAEIKGNINFMAGNLTPADVQVPIEIISSSSVTLLKK